MAVNKTKLPAVSSDDEEDSMLIAASLTKGTKAKKPAKGEPCFPSFLLAYFC